MPAILRQLAFAITLPLLLAACASSPPQTAAEPAVEPSTRGTTDDLALVADIALQLAERKGPDAVLVVLDIDNTILAMEQGLGSDQWYYWQKDRAETDPCDPRVVADRFAVQGAMYYASAMRPTQPDAARHVARMQSAGIPVIALSSRGADYRLQTFRELRRNGFSFWASALPPRHGWSEPFVPEGGERPARYEDGVFLTAGQHKGQMLEALLSKTGAARPEAIVVVDDRQDNLDAFWATFGAGDVALHAWRYTGEDATVAAFDPDQAAAQWDTLRPALQTLENVLGTDNIDLPESDRNPACQTP